jgi:hypothetical protein
MGVGLREGGIKRLHTILPDLVTLLHTYPPAQYLAKLSATC